MVSPFENYANATLTFNVPSADLTLDDWGNPKVEYEAIKIIALLEPSASLRNQDSPGVTTITTEYSGYLVYPTSLPNNLSPNSIGSAEIKISKNTYLKGSFQLVPIAQDPYVLALGIEIVTRIRGIFTIQV